MKTYNKTCPICGNIFKQHKSKYIAYSKIGKIVNAIGFVSIPLMIVIYTTLSSYGMLSFARAGGAGSLALVSILSISIILWLCSYIFLRCIRLKCSCGNVSEFNIEAVPIDSDIILRDKKWQISPIWYFFTKAITFIVTTILSICIIMCVIFWSAEVIIMTISIIISMILILLLMALNNKVAKRRILHEIAQQGDRPEPVSGHNQ
jgi:hypothetical protein